MASTSPVILVGAQRSGTTALAFTLSSAFAAAGGMFTVNGKLPYLLHRWCSDADVAGRHLRADEIIHALRRRKPLGPGGARWLDHVESVLRTMADQVAHGEWNDALALRRAIVRDSYAPAERFGDKYNEYLLDIDSLVRTMPEAHLVLLVRHPLDVAASVLRWGGDRPWLPRNVSAALAKWVAWHQPFLAHPISTDRSRCTVVEYRSVCGGTDLHHLGKVIGLDLRPHAAALIPRDAAIGKHDLPEPVLGTYEVLMERRQGPLPQRLIGHRRK